MSTWKWNRTGIDEAVASYKLQATSYKRQATILKFRLFAVLLLLEACSLKLAAKKPCLSRAFLLMLG
jgi:hypothetical protein